MTVSKGPIGPTGATAKMRQHPQQSSCHRGDGIGVHANEIILNDEGFKSLCLLF